MPQCKSCKAEIRWLIMASGKRMPVDAKPNAAGNIGIDEEGRGVVLSKAPNEGHWSGLLYTSHFATCPHAKAHRRADGHHCHAPGCKVEVPPAMFMCRPHWYMLPKPLRDAVWAAYRPGQEEDKEVTVEYVEAAQAAKDYIRQKEGRTP